MQVNTGSTQSLNKLADQSRQIRARFEPQWYMNLAFFLGDQWVYWNRGRLDHPTLASHRLLVTENRIMPIILTRLAKKTKQRPVWTVVPNSGDDANIVAAQLSEQIMEGMWKDLDMQNKLFEALMWADICCAGFWKICWDSTAGDKADIVLGQDGQPIQGQDGKLLRKEQVPPELLKERGLRSKSISEGEVRIEVRSPFEILTDPLANRIGDCEWIIEEVIQSEEYVRSHHGVELSGDTEVSAGPSDSRFFPSWRMGGGTAYQGVKVRELWLKSCTKYPKGQHVVWAKDKILRQEDNPYEDLPYVCFSGVQVPGRFWPTSIVEQLREPQIELNKIKSQIRENAQRIGNPALLKDRNANVKYSGVPGEEVLFDGMMTSSVPAYLTPPNMPTYVVDEIERLEGTIREIAGQHEVSQSTVPTGVTAASAINLLLEQDDTRLGPAITELENVLGYSGQMVLKLIAQYYQEERMIKLVGEDQSYDFVSFRGESLKGNTQVEVQAGSQFPSSKAAQQAAIESTLNLFLQQGQPLDPRILRKVLRDYQVGGIEAFFMDVGKDEAQTNREHRMMYNGQPLPINDFDNDEVHIANHEDEMKSSRFFHSDSTVQSVMLTHLGLHKDRESSRQRDAAQSQFQAESQADQAKVAGDVQKIIVEYEQKMKEDYQNAIYKLEEIKVQNATRPKPSPGGGSK